MRVLVTGASSTIGRRIVELLDRAGHEPSSFTRDRAFHPVGKVVLGDLREPGTLAGALEGMDAVIHAAAVTHSRDPRTYFEVNVEGTRALLAEAGAANVRRFIFASSRAVGRGGGAYAESKLLAEEAVRASTMDWVIVRPAEVYGTDKREGIGDLVDRSRKGRLVPFVAGKAAKVAPVFVEDVARAIARATTDDTIRRKTYTLAGPDEYTLGELVTAVARSRGRSPIKVPIPAQLVALALRLRLPLPIVPDQLRRLLMPKDSSSAEARADLGFDPISFPEWLRQSG
jgi:NADH dehydrogenase